MAGRRILLDRGRAVDRGPARGGARSRGLRRRHRSDAEAGLEAFEGRPPDLVLLDVMLPDGDGRDVLRRIRASSETSVAMLTARGAELDRVLGSSSAPTTT